MSAISKKKVRDFLDRSRRARKMKRKGQIFEDLVCYLVESVPGIAKPKRNILNPYHSEEVDVSFWNERPASGFYFLPNTILIDKLNRLGERLTPRGVRLYMVGPGDISRLDRRHVTHLGVVSYDAAWDYIFHADVGVVVAPGPFVHNNESTKIYHYLRAGVPVVSEAGFPNDHVVVESRLGYVVPNGDVEAMAARVEDAANRQWDRAAAIDYVLRHHTWHARAAVYQPLITTRAAETVRAQ